MKIKTGIKGFDKLTNGGIPQNKLVLLSGSPGTGKTILALQYAYEGAKQFGEKSIFITFEETAQSIKSQAKQFGWDLDSVSDKLEIIQYPIQALTDKTGEEIIDIISRSKAKRFVIDSLSALSFNVPTIQESFGNSKSTIQKFIYTFISALRERNCSTGILISQTSRDNMFSNDGVSEFICDGIVHIYYEAMGGSFSRSIQIRKMRQVHHDEGVYPLEITSKGMKIHYE
jgi:circadian clock protein KaiC